MGRRRRWVPVCLTQGFNTDRRDHFPHTHRSCGRTQPWPNYIKKDENRFRFQARLPGVRKKGSIDPVKTPSVQRIAKGVSQLGRQFRGAEISLRRRDIDKSPKLMPSNRHLMESLRHVCSNQTVVHIRLILWEFPLTSFWLGFLAVLFWGGNRSGSRNSSIARTCG